MGWRSASISSRAQSHKSQSHKSRAWEDDEEDMPEGVELSFVCKDVPVLSLDKSSVFSENASWMLQSALSSSAKADALYEYYDDREIMQECRRLGLRDDEVSVVRVRQKDLRHVKAVGTSGKRSVMLAVVVALAMQDSFDLKALCKELRDYKLDPKEFLALIELSRKSTESPPQSEDEEEDTKDDALEDEGVELKLIGKGIPVLGLTKDSIFQENASWLIQTASGTCGKADSVFEYFSDRDILNECRRMGLTEQEVGLVRLKGKQQHVQAVGTCGKRSIMLALVVALVLTEEMTPAQLMKEVNGYDSALENPVRVLLRAVLGLAGRSVAELKEDDNWGKGKKESKGDDWGSWDTCWSGKRKWRDDDDYDYGYDWSKWGPDREHSLAPANKKKGGTLPPREGANEKSLDQQLDDYWDDGDD